MSDTGILNELLKGEGYFLTADELERVAPRIYAERDELRQECDEWHAIADKLSSQAEELKELATDAMGAWTDLTGALFPGKDDGDSVGRMMGRNK